MEQRFYGLGPTLRHVRVDRFLSLIAVIDNQGFTAAADALYLSQPQVSRHISELEEALGFRLIDRLARPPKPTADGEQFADHAREILETLRAAAKESVEYLEGPIGSVVIGMYPSAAYHAYPTLRRWVGARIPAVDLQLWEGMPHELLSALAESTVDLVVRPSSVADTRRHSMIDSTRLWTEPLVAVTQPTPELTTSSHVDIDYLLDMDLIAIGNPRVPSPPENEVGEALKTSGLLSQIAMLTDLPATLVAMVRGGLGTGIINKLAIDTVDTRDLMVRPIAGDAFERSVYLSWRKQDASRRNIKRIVKTVTEFPVPNT